MNRAEMRRQQKANQKLTKTRMMSNADIEKLKKKAMDDSVYRSLTVLLGLSIYALRAEYGFGEQRLTRFIDRVMSAYKAFEEGRFTLADLHVIVFQETGMTITDENNECIIDLEQAKDPKYQRENDHMADVIAAMLEEAM